MNTARTASNLHIDPSVYSRGERSCRVRKGHGHDPSGDYGGIPSDEDRADHSAARLLCHARWCLGHRCRFPRPCVFPCEAFGACSAHGPPRMHLLLRPTKGSPPGPLALRARFLQRVGRFGRRVRSRGRGLLASKERTEKDRTTFVTSDHPPSPNGPSVRGFTA
jgi:hypothetical protein